jgi:hypothetical protein
MLFMIFMVQQGPTRFTMKSMKAMKGHGEKGTEEAQVEG